MESTSSKLSIIFGYRVMKMNLCNFVDDRSKDELDKEQGKNKK